MISAICLGFVISRILVENEKSADPLPGQSGRRRWLAPQPRDRSRPPPRRRRERCRPYLAHHISGRWMSSTQPATVEAAVSSCDSRLLCIQFGPPSGSVSRALAELIQDWESAAPEVARCLQHDRAAALGELELRPDRRGRASMCGALGSRRLTWSAAIPARRRLHPLLEGVHGPPSELQSDGRIADFEREPKPLYALRAPDTRPGELEETRWERNQPPAPGLARVRVRVRASTPATHGSRDTSFRKLLRPQGNAQSHQPSYQHK